MNTCTNPNCKKLFTVKAGSYGKYCSLSCGTSHRNYVKKEKQLQNYSLMPKLCQQCNTPIPYEKRNNKFCSNSCAGQYTNARKDFSLIQTGPKVGTVKGQKKSAPRTKICVICSNNHTKKSQTCSNECKCKLLSLNMRFAIANGHNPNNNRGRGRRSYLEKSFNQWLTDNYPNLLYYQEYSFKRLDTIKTYFADFYFPSLQLIIELDGTQHNSTQEYDKERDQYIELTYGVTILRISHKEYRQKTKIDLVKSLLQN